MATKRRTSMAAAVADALGEDVTPEMAMLVEETTGTPKARNGRATKIKPAATTPANPETTAPEPAGDLRPEETVATLKARITELEAEIERLTARRTRTPRQQTDKSGPWGDPIPSVNVACYRFFRDHWPEKLDVLDALAFLREKVEANVEAGTIDRHVRACVVYGVGKHAARERGEPYLPPGAVKWMEARGMPVPAGAALQAKADSAPEAVATANQRRRYERERKR